MNPWLIEPGVRLGNISLSDAPELAFARLGPSQAHDAAMQKSWNTWIGKGGGRLDIYVVNDRAGTEAERRTIHIIRVTSSRFHLANGLHTGALVKTMTRAYPKAFMASSYVSPSGRIAVWDDTQRGLGWEVGASGRVVALFIHDKGKPYGMQVASYVSMAIH